MVELSKNSRKVEEAILFETEHTHACNEVLELCLCFKSSLRTDRGVGGYHNVKFQGQRAEAKEYVHEKIGLTNSTGDTNSYYRR